MRFAPITAIVIAMCLIALVNSFPASETRFRSKMLERVMVKESNEDPAARGKRTIGILRQFFPSITKETTREAEKQVQDASVAESNHNEVKVQFADQDNLEAATDSGDLPPLEEIEVPEDENRNKRFLSFGFGGSGAAGGSGGGSGNFLFDIIRLVAGSGSAPSDGNSTVRTEEEAVPGPITRLFVIANRGISNLVQDIILRLAATSERIVNFKARLITSII
ncbi:uncharacterized protein LOC141529083 isoform X2 [Cotesia typhae]|uniref:uncharacterized protein LOC141529083 isoform X2 n=1 Tax=Cotesia typhae TaxID=2053667 RepID=UPI003D6867AC